MSRVMMMLATAIWLVGCGSTTVVDSGPDEDIASDVTADAGDSSGGDTVSTVDTTTEDAATPDVTPEDSASSSDIAPCDSVGCPCDAASACTNDLVCADGACCAPSCDGKECGDDGCGGTCGACEGDFGCNDLGACMICEPNVSVCVGNSTSTCNNQGDGYSGVPFDCADLPDTPDCEDGACVCSPDCAGKTCGDDGCGGTCGTCDESTETCLEGQCACAPQCEGLDCGPDGCGTTCGECKSGVCNEGLCESPAQPAGETCDSPYEIEELPFNLSQGSTTKATDDELYECQGLDEPVGDLALGFGPDEVYAVEIASPGMLSVGFSTWNDVGNSDWPMMVYLRSNCLETCSAYMGMAVANQSAILKMPVGKAETVYIIVDGVGPDDAGTYNLNVTFTED